MASVSVSPSSQKRPGRVKGQGYYPPKVYTIRFNVLLSPEIRRMADELAAMRNISVGELIRTLIVEEYERVKARKEKRKERPVKVKEKRARREVELGLPVEVAPPEPADDFISGNPWLEIIAARSHEG